MSNNAKAELRALTCRYYKWCLMCAEQEDAILSAYGNKFYDRVEEQM